MIYKNEQEITRIISYRYQFFDSAIFIVRSLSNFINNSSEGIPKIKCKNRNDDKGYATFGIRYKNVGGVLNPQELKINRIEMFMLQ